MPFGNFKLDAGVRVEDNLQQLNGKDLSGNDANSNLPVTRVLPSANLSYNFTNKMLVRTAYGETLNRPEFREIAKFTFFDFNFNFVYQGTPGLKTAQIQNLDLRWEYYPSAGELITFGGFYKDFQNPIETYIDLSNGGGGGVKNVFFDNAQSAKVYGVELEIKKSLAGLSQSGFLSKLNVLVNATVISSNIKIPASLATNGRASERPLQGQAPYVINTGVFYVDEQSGWTVNLLHNVVGKSIVFVGGSSYPDVYQMPRNVVDLVFTKRITERFQIKGGISDILNQPIVFMQDGNKTDGTKDGSYDLDKDVVIQQYKPGQVFSIGFNWRL
jgi:outer membrane receptor protein involved in Fe transport